MGKLVSKFNPNSDIKSISVNGVDLTVHETYYKPGHNIGGITRAVKNLTVSGKLPIGTGISADSFKAVAAGKNAEISFFSDCACEKCLCGYNIAAGENLIYAKVKDGETGDCQIYTVVIIGTGDAKFDAAYNKYAEPTVIVSDIDSVRVAMDESQPGQVIGVVKGDYYVFAESKYNPRPRFDNKHNVILRSISGDFEDVTFWGSGLHKLNADGENVAGAYQAATPHNEMIEIGGASSDIVLYGITIRESNANGYKINGTNERNITLDTCRAIDICEYMVKGSGPSNDLFVFNLTIVNCHFENTKRANYIPQSDHTIQCGGYIGAIDIMNTRVSYIADNKFINLLGNSADKYSYHNFGAIGFWGQGGHEDALVERNFIYNCGSAIMLGLTGELSSGRPTVNRGIVRNNIIFASGWDAITSCNTRDVQIYNNTIIRGVEDPNGIDRGIRDAYGNSKNLTIKNNLAHSFQMNGIDAHDDVIIEDNLVVGDIDPDTYFVNLPKENRCAELALYYHDNNVKPEDFALTDKAVNAIGKAQALPVLVDEDYFGNKRGGNPDIGAHQFSAQK